MGCDVFARGPVPGGLREGCCCCFCCNLRCCACSCVNVVVVAVVVAAWVIILILVSEKKLAQQMKCLTGMMMLTMIPLLMTAREIMTIL